MSRPIVLGNGKLVVCLDNSGYIRNLYYHYPGLEDHVRGHHHRIGIWIDGKFSWLSDNEWERSIKYKKDTLVGEINLTNRNLGISLKINDAVHHNLNIFLKKVTIKNLENKHKSVKLFINQHFHITGDDQGDTVYYSPINKSLISYKGRRYFLINGLHNKKGFSQFATGAADEGEKEGTYKDAEDGFLSGNLIEHGSVDSTIAFDFNVKSNSSEIVHYWIAVGKNLNKVEDLHNLILKKSPETLLKQTEIHWRRWANKADVNFYNLRKPLIELFKRSLLIIRTHTSNNGAILASLDTGPMNQKRDNYAYVWPRDGALITRSLDKAGYNSMTNRFFEFCKDVASREGYLFHKYLPNKAIGSSWHPWIACEKVQLPIQEDETALVLDGLWKKYKKYKDKKYIKPFYKEFIKPAGDFLEEYRNKKTKLPSQSYDLWESKLGVHTFTCCTTYAGLLAAYNFAKLFKKSQDAKKYLKAAEEVKKAILKYLYDKESGMFIKRLYQDESARWLKDKTIDMSTAYGIFQFKVLPVDDLKVEENMNKTLEHLRNKHCAGGVLRFEDDDYFRIDQNTPGNPWFISTMWLAQYYIAKAKTYSDLKPALEIFEWVLKHALPSGVLSEQVNPHTGEQVSYAPLIWSHASYVITIIKYISKIEKLGINK